MSARLRGAWLAFFIAASCTVTAPARAAEDAGILDEIEREGVERTAEALRNRPAHGHIAGTRGLTELQVDREFLVPGGARERGERVQLDECCARAAETGDVLDPVRRSTAGKDDIGRRAGRRYGDLAIVAVGARIATHEDSVVDAGLLAVLPAQGDPLLHLVVAAEAAAQRREGNCVDARRFPENEAMSARASMSGACFPSMTASSDH